MISGFLNNISTKFFSKEVKNPPEDKDMLKNLTHSSISLSQSPPSHITEEKDQNYDHIRKDRRQFLSAINDTPVVYVESKYTEKSSDQKPYLKKLGLHISEKIQPSFLKSKKQKLNIDNIQTDNSYNTPINTNNKIVAINSKSSKNNQPIPENEQEKSEANSESSSGGQLLSENGQEKSETNSESSGGGKLLSENGQEMSEANPESSGGGKLLSENEQEISEANSESSGGGKLLSENGQEKSETNSESSGGGQLLSEGNQDVSETSSGGSYLDNNDDDPEDEIEVRGTSKLFRSSVIKIQGSYIVKVMPNGKKQILSKLTRKRHLKKNKPSKKRGGR